MHASTLTGKRLLLTRATHQMGELEEKVRRAGAIPVPFPCLELQPLPDAIREAFGRMQPADDIAFSSANGIEHTALAAAESLAELLQGHRTAVVGERTAMQLRKHGVEPHIIPETPSQEGLIAAYQRHGLPKRLIFFRAEEGNDVLVSFLRSHGCEVDLVATYRSICPEGDASDIIRQLQNNRIDAVLLGSPKAARHYLQRIGNPDIANRAAIAVISPAVAEAAREIGLDVQVVAKQASFDAMLNGLKDFFAQGRD
ncbi:MAG TPA: uroporphyrinogen-III synthase [Mariprofundaceae bacterium]|nr:uroporphyrinogen-III synthase [Mariprofundaceae bacterium]